jgi:hypothetical protein
LRDKTLQETTFELNNANSRLLALKDQLADANQRVDNATQREIEQRYDCDLWLCVCVVQQM